MPADNFDFGGHIEDDRDINPSPFTEEDEKCFSVFGLIAARVGHEKATSLYSAMERLAKEAAAEHGGVPGIAFDVEGGRFVAFTEPRE